MARSCTAKFSCELLLWRSVARCIPAIEPTAAGALAGFSAPPPRWCPGHGGGQGELVHRSAGCWLRPMPAPKPSSRIQSGAVEYPGCSAFCRSAMPGPWSVAVMAIGLGGDLGRECAARQAVDDDIHLRLVGGHGHAPDDARVDAQAPERLLELAGGAAGVGEVANARRRNSGAGRCGPTECPRRDGWRGSGATPPRDRPGAAP